MKPVHEAAADLCARVAQAVQAVAPPGLRARFTIHLTDGKVNAHDCEVSFRPVQPKAGMRSPQS